MGKITHTVFPVFVLVTGVLVLSAFDMQGNAVVYAQTGTGVRDDMAGKVPVEKDKLLAPEAPIKEKPPLKKTPDTPEGIIKNDPAAEKPAEKADIAENIRRKAEPPKIYQKEAPPGDGILLIDDGPLRYARIPGYKEPDNSTGIAETKEKKDNDTQGKTGSVSSSDAPGLLGMSRKSTDLLAKGVLAGIIILIVVLYRLRTKRNRSSVLKRFPKA